MVEEFPNAQKLVACPSCGSADLKAFRSGVDYHYGIEGTFQTERCDDCGLVMLSPMPTVDDLGRLYPDDYYSYQPPILNKSFARKLALAFGLRTTTHVPLFKVPGKMIDIGCGAGQFMLEMQAKGWDVQGVELSRAAAEAGRKAGLNIFDGELQQAHFPDSSFDFVRSNHSFEHMPNPSVTLDEMGRILKPAGRILIGIPNLDSAWARLFGRHWWNFGLPVHTFNYTRKSIIMLLERHGFKVERLLYNSDFSGFLGSAQIRLNAAAGKRSSAGAMRANWPLKIIAAFLSRTMDVIHKGDCIEIVCSKRNV